jgi:hypothetical protein
MPKKKQSSHKIAKSPENNTTIANPYDQLFKKISLYPLMEPDDKPWKDALGNPIYVKGLTTGEISKKHKKRK